MRKLKQVRQTCAMQSGFVGMRALMLTANIWVRLLAKPGRTLVCVCVCV